MIIAIMDYNGREICFSASNEDEAKKAFPGGVVIRTLDADEAYSNQIEEAVYRAKEHRYRLFVIATNVLKRFILRTKMPIRLTRRILKIL